MVAPAIKADFALQFFQNNTKKMNLAEIATQAEENGSAASGLVIEELEMPSVFAEAQGDQGPASGYFDSQHNGKHASRSAPSSGGGGGGMHLRNLLDDAPDAEGGAIHHDDYTTPPIPPELVDGPGGDSSTEDEADPARYATSASALKKNGHLHHRRVVSHGSVRLDPAAASHVQHLPPRRDLHPAAYASHRNGQEAYYGRSVYSDPRHSPEFGTRDLVSPVYGQAAYAERGYLPPQHGLPPLSSRLAAYPGARQWSPYESRTIYSSQGPASSLHSPYYRTSERRNSEDLSHMGRPSPPLHPPTYFRRSQGDVVKGLPPPGPGPAAPYAHSPIYEAPPHAYYAYPQHAHAPQPPLQHLRASEGPEHGSPYHSAGSYGHLSRSR